MERHHYEPEDDDSGYEGFHTYASSELYDTSDGVRRWPDNWAQPDHPGHPGYDDDEDPHTGRDYWVVLLWTALFYAVPGMFLVGRALLTSDPSARTAALADLIDNAPLWLAAVAAALVLALVLRWASDTWRAATIGFCAAVVSGGAITVLYRIW